tara:strand:+ start:597 stop:971 length:375 start_codon:yes stop_codon:yes gene_type:complete
MLYTIFKLKENAYKVNEYACYEKEKGNSLPAMWDGLFEEVAVIRADNLEEVFDVGNQNPEKVFHKGHRKLYTINVGDLIHDGNNFIIVASRGFDTVKDLKEKLEKQEKINDWESYRRKWRVVSA